MNRTFWKKSTFSNYVLEMPYLKHKVVKLLWGYINWFQKMQFITKSTELFWDRWSLEAIFVVTEFKISISPSFFMNFPIRLIFFFVLFWWNFKNQPWRPRKELGDNPFKTTAWGRGVPMCRWSKGHSK